MTHDFAITHKHAVFLEGALYVAPEVERGRRKGGREGAA